MTSEPSVIHYTTDGSTPTLSSPTYKAQRARSVGQVLTVSTPGTSTVKWLAVDIKGNVSAVQSKTFLLDTVGSDDHDQHRRGRGVHAGPAGSAHVRVR